MNAFINFTESQINDIVSSYASGNSLSQIGERYNVSRPTIQRVVKGNYPAYTGKKRATVATVNQTKVCTKCGKELPLEAFNRGNSLYGRRSFCRECEKEIQKTPEKAARRREYHRITRQDPEKRKAEYERDRIRRLTNKDSIKKSLLRAAKQRAKVKGLEFNIDISDVELPEVCPLLGIPLASSDLRKAQDNSYSIDRIDSSKGYIKGNVWVISRRANIIKNDATFEELELLVNNLRKHYAKDYVYDKSRG